MGYLALYRKYRPSSFEEVVGQDKIIKVINNAIINNKVSHAYLFSGPRGTGKTTTAKIIAKMVNCENLLDGKPCNKCDSCLNILNSSDVVEIDAASNNGVEEIREIRDKVNFVPTSCRYKVYIIDEVHMLTTQAFNALLKTLEEPPTHVIFILATTEIYKIPLTISSRCQKFQFTKIADDVIVKRLQEICKLENIDFEEEALYEVARLADGGLRDAINLLDQLTAYKDGKITIDDVFKINGSVSYVDLCNLLNYVIAGDNGSIIAFVENIDKNGKNISKFVEEMIIFLKDVLVYKATSSLTMISEKNSKIKDISVDLEENDIFAYIDELNDLLSKFKVANYPAILLIVSLLKLSLAKKTDDDLNERENDSVIVKDVNAEVKNEVGIVVNEEDKQQDIEDASLSLVEKVDEKYSVKIDVDIRINNALATAEKTILNDVKQGWGTITNYLLNDKFSVVVGLLSDVVPVVASLDYVILECKYEATALRLNELESVLSDLLFEVYHKRYKVVSISVDRWKYERDKYVDSIKKGITYKLLEEPVNLAVENNKEIDDSPLGKLVELLGEDVIEYK